MAAVITIRTWTKDSSAIEFHPVPPWRTDMMELAECTDHLREEMDQGKISGYEVKMEK